VAGNVSEWMMSQYEPCLYNADDGRNDPAGRCGARDQGEILGTAFVAPVLTEKHAKGPQTWN